MAYELLHTSRDYQYPGLGILSSIYIDFILLVSKPSMFILLALTLWRLLKYYDGVRLGVPQNYSCNGPHTLGHQDV